MPIVGDPNDLSSCAHGHGVDVMSRATGGDGFVCPWRAVTVKCRREITRRAGSFSLRMTVSPARCAIATVMSA